MEAEKVEDITELAGKIDAEGDEVAGEGEVQKKSEGQSIEPDPLDLSAVEVHEEEKKDEFDPDKVDTKTWGKSAQSAFAQMARKLKEFKKEIETVKSTTKIPDEVENELKELRGFRSSVDIQQDPEFIRLYKTPITDANAEVQNTLTAMGMEANDIQRVLVSPIKERLEILKAKAPDMIGMVGPTLIRRDQLVAKAREVIKNHDAELPKLLQARSSRYVNEVAAIMPDVHKAVTKDLTILRPSGTNKAWDARVAQRIEEAKKLAVNDDPKERARIALLAVSVSDLQTINQRLKDALLKAEKQLGRKIEGRPSLGSSGAGGTQTRAEAFLEKGKKAKSIEEVAAAVDENSD